MQQDKPEVRGSIGWLAHPAFFHNVSNFWTSERLKIAECVWPVSWCFWLRYGWWALRISWDFSIGSTRISFSASDEEIREGFKKSSSGLSLEVLIQVVGGKLFSLNQIGLTVDESASLKYIRSERTSLKRSLLWWNASAVGLAYHTGRKDDASIH